MIEYREYRPTAALAHHVKCYWLLRGRAKAGAAPERILPDGCVEIIFNFAAPFQRHLPEGNVERQARAILAGPSSRAVQIEPTGRMDLLGVRFQPGGAWEFLELAMTELLDEIPSLELFWNGRGNRIWNELGDTAAESRVRLLERGLREKLNARGASGVGPMNLFAEVARRGGQMSVEEMGASAGVSMRQVERWFLRHVGLGPKVFSRILRMQNAIQALQRERIFDWAGAACATGYFDQAHFNRDFKEFSGVTPTEYFGAAHPIASCFSAEKQMSDFSNTAMGRCVTLPA